MNVRQIPAGSTDRSVNLKIVDASDGTSETGVVYNTSGIDLWYRREGAAKVSITEADLSTPALTDAHADGGFLHISDGLYRLDLPDAALAAGVPGVQIGGTVTGMEVLAPYIELTTDVPQTGDAYARLGAPAGASVSADVAAVKSDSAAILEDTNELQADDIPAAIAGIEAALVITSEYIDTEVAAIKAVTDVLPDSGALTSLAQASALATTDGKIDTLTTNVGTVDTVVDGIKTKTDQLVFGVTNTLNTNVTYVNEVEITGSGTSLAPWKAVE